MPELPEVESTVRYLQEKIVGSIIRDVQVLWHRTVATHSPAAFTTALVGRKFRSVSRRGKYIICELEGGTQKLNYLLMHLRMTGSIDVISGREPIDKHDRVIFFFKDGGELHYHDPRKFGKMYLVSELAFLETKLGPEPLDPLLNTEKFHALLKKRDTTLKTFLLDQSNIAGIGNIYADEALWFAGLHPRARTKKVTLLKAERLLTSIRKVLSEAIEKFGTDFGDGVVEMGGYAPSIYGRAGEGCLRCQGVIRRIVVQQRSTHLCVACQPLRRSGSCTGT